MKITVNVISFHVSRFVLKFRTLHLHNLFIFIFILRSISPINVGPKHELYQL